MWLLCDVSRLVLGFLAEQDCPKSYLTFLDECVHFNNVRQHFPRDPRDLSNVSSCCSIFGESLISILAEFTTMKEVHRKYSNRSDLIAKERCFKQAWDSFQRAFVSLRSCQALLLRERRDAQVDDGSLRKMTEMNKRVEHKTYKKRSLFPDHPTTPSYDRSPPISEEDYRASRPTSVRTKEFRNFPQQPPPPPPTTSGSSSTPTSGRNINSPSINPTTTHQHDGVEEVMTSAGSRRHRNRRAPKRLDDEERRTCNNPFADKKKEVNVFISKVGAKVISEMKKASAATDPISSTALEVYSGDHSINVVDLFNENSLFDTEAALRNKDSIVANAMDDDDLTHHELAMAKQIESFLDLDTDGLNQYLISNEAAAAPMPVQTSAATQQHNIPPAVVTVLPSTSATNIPPSTSRTPTKQEQPSTTTHHHYHYTQPSSAKRLDFESATSQPQQQATTNTTQVTQLAVLAPLPLTTARFSGRGSDRVFCLVGDKVKVPPVVPPPPRYTHNMESVEVVTDVQPYDEDIKHSHQIKRDGEMENPSERSDDTDNNRIVVVESESETSMAVNNLLQLDSRSNSRFVKHQIEQQQQHQQQQHVGSVEPSPLTSPPPPVVTDDVVNNKHLDAVGMSEGGTTDTAPEQPMEVEMLVERKSSPIHRGGKKDLLTNEPDSPAKRTRSKAGMALRKRPAKTAASSQSVSSGDEDNNQQPPAAKSLKRDPTKPAGRKKPRKQRFTRPGAKKTAAGGRKRGKQAQQPVEVVDQQQHLVEVIDHQQHPVEVVDQQHPVEVIDQQHQQIANDQEVEQLESPPPQQPVPDFVVPMEENISTTSKKSPEDIQVTVTSEIDPSNLTDVLGIIAANSRRTGQHEEQRITVVDHPQQASYPPQQPVTTSLTHLLNSETSLSSYLHQFTSAKSSTTATHSVATEDHKTPPPRTSGFETISLSALDDIISVEQHHQQHTMPTSATKGLQGWLQSGPYRESVRPPPSPCKPAESVVTVSSSTPSATHTLTSGTSGSIVMSATSGKPPVPGGSLQPRQRVLSCDERGESPTLSERSLHIDESTDRLEKGTTPNKRNLSIIEEEESGDEEEEDDELPVDDQLQCTSRGSLRDAQASKKSTSSRSASSRRISLTRVPISPSKLGGTKIIGSLTSPYHQRSRSNLSSPLPGWSENSQHSSPCRQHAAQPTAVPPSPGSVTLTDRPPTGLVRPVTSSSSSSSPVVVGTVNLDDITPASEMKDEEKQQQQQQQQEEGTTRRRGREKVRKEPTAEPKKRQRKTSNQKTKEKQQNKSPLAKNSDKLYIHEEEVSSQKPTPQLEHVDNIPQPPPIKEHVPLTHQEYMRQKAEDEEKLRKEEEERRLSSEETQNKCEEEEHPQLKQDDDDEDDFRTKNLPKRHQQEEEELSSPQHNELVVEQEIEVITDHPPIEEVNHISTREEEEQHQIIPQVEEEKHSDKHKNHISPPPPHEEEKQHNKTNKDDFVANDHQNKKKKKKKKGKKNKRKSGELNLEDLDVSSLVMAMHGNKATT